MDPKLLMVACSGDCSRLTDLLDMPPQVIVNVDHPAPFAGSLLEGVTSEGDSALHAVETCGDNGNFLECAKVIYDRANHVLCAPNKHGDTPLHCAARARNLEMVSHLIALARGGDDERAKAVLRKQNNHGETALHEAVRSGNEDLVDKLLKEDSELARVPSKGTSPLYLAVFFQHHKIIKQLFDHGKDLSYCGPHGQNALHAAVLRNIGITRTLLDWKKDLTEELDGSGSTPLHVAASWKLKQLNTTSTLPPLLEANPTSPYKPDDSGSFAIHIAFAASILNIQDKDGNTALHLAVQAGDLKSFSSLMGNLQVVLDLPNFSGQTPRDISRSKLPARLYFEWNPQKLIHRALGHAGAKYGCYRRDYFKENNTPQPIDAKDLEQIKESTQTLGISSVLIAAVTFGAAFSPPGGYVADDHANGGAPTLAGRYTFDAFITANTLAFICSLLATISLMFSGTPMVDFPLREKHINRAVFLSSSSFTCLGAAFALGLYMVLAPVAHNTAIAIWVIICLAPIIGSTDLLRTLSVAMALRRRLGSRICLVTLYLVFGLMIFEFWPLPIILGWPAYSTKYRHN